MDMYMWFKNWPWTIGDGYMYLCIWNLSFNGLGLESSSFDFYVVFVTDDMSTMVTEDVRK